MKTLKKKRRNPLEKLKESDLLSPSKAVLHVAGSSILFSLFEMLEEMEMVFFDFERVSGKEREREREREKERDEKRKR